MGNRNKKKPVERLKSRKELRKDKRLQKKANRVHFQKRKKELKIEYKERLKQQQQGKKGKPNGKVGAMQDQKHKTKENEDEFIDEGSFVGGDDADEEIESDFELSDEELETKTNSVAKQSKPVKKPATQLELDHERLKKQEQSLRKDMGKQRIKQLKRANEDEDKTINKLEKLLKINKSKGKRKAIPNMFNDGLDYALEMCLPENIEKMYAAAKEAADAEQQSDSEWQEDFAVATGDVETTSNNGNADKNVTKPKMKKEKPSIIPKPREEKRVKRLREIESKYFGASDDELASDLSDVDSEFERDENDSELENSDAELDFEDESEADDDDDDDDDVDDQDDDDFDENDSDDDEAPEEIQTVTKSSHKRKMEKLEKTSATQKGNLNERDSDEDLSEDDFDMDSFDEDSEDEPKSKVQKVKGDPDSDDDFGSDAGSDAGSDHSDEAEKPDIWEDIYGRKRDKQGNVINEKTSDENNTGKYMPPHLRARLAEQAANGSAEGEMDPKRKEKLMRLKRLLKGQLNRLSEANMHKISSEIDSLYMQNSRYDMNTTLSILISDALISQVLAPERMVMEHALLVAALHANVGTEVGANMLENLVDRCHKMLERGIEQYDVEDKTLDNVIFFLCHMYTFKIFHHRLVYDLLNKLLDTFCEKSIECVLLTLRSIGFSLRKDDPAALKELIITIQKKTSEASEELKTNARLKYMLDVLTAIKNNNVNRIPNYDPTLAEHLRKILKSLCVNGKYVTTLNISLEDLLNVQNRGKWWVVGSAWTGNINDISGAAKATSSKKEDKKFSEQLLELARKQRMNTDERRNVFCILMSAEDYIDAFEKILHLAIKDHRVAVSVIIHCCLSEKTFNPYYAVVAHKFCDYDRKYQLAVQYAVWDRIKDINSHSKIQLANLAQFLIHLITNAALPISVLKVIEFGEIDKITLRLVRQILLGILLGNEEICKEVFQRIAPSAQLKAFKDSMRLFMHHFLLKGGAKNGIAEDKMQLLRQRIQIADKSLSTSAIRF